MTVVGRDRVVELERKLAEGEERKLGEEKSGGTEDGSEGDRRMEAEDEGVLELMASEGEMAAASDEVEMKSVAGSDVRERTMETRANRMREDGVAEGRDARRKKCESSESEAEWKKSEGDLEKYDRMEVTRRKSDVAEGKWIGGREKGQRR